MRSNAKTIRTVGDRSRAHHRRTPGGPSASRVQGSHDAIDPAAPARLQRVRVQAGCAVPGEDGLGRVEANALDPGHGRLRCWFPTTQLWHSMPCGRPAGKPDAGNPHVGLDERGGETGRANDTVSFLDSTVILASSVRREEFARAGNSDPVTAAEGGTWAVTPFSNSQRLKINRTSKRTPSVIIEVLPRISVGEGILFQTLRPSHIRHNPKHRRWRHQQVLRRSWTVSTPKSVAAPDQRGDARPAPSMDQSASAAAPCISAATGWNSAYRDR
jgi:hypothetical protein